LIQKITGASHARQISSHSASHQTGLLWGGVGHCSLENKNPRSQSPRQPLKRSVTAPQAPQKLRSKNTRSPALFASLKEPFFPYPLNALLKYFTNNMGYNYKGLLTFLSLE
jgi:hypothetical protein